MGLLSSLGAAAGVINPVAALGTGLAMGGDILNFVGTQQTNRQNAANVQATNATEEAIANQNNAMQMQLAQSGLGMKIQDAANYGISPLAAIGASDPSASFSTPNLQTPEYQSPLSGLGHSLSDMGQDAARAALAFKDDSDRAATALDLQHKQLENDYLSTLIKNAKLSLLAQPGQPPAPDFQFMRDSDGYLYKAPSQAYSQMHGADIGSQWSWALNNKLIPSINELYQNLIAHNFNGPDTQFKVYPGMKGE